MCPAYHHFVTRGEYEAEICRRLPNVRGVKFEDKGTTDRCCHTNVDHWVNEHAEEGFKAVRGWIVYMPEVYVHPQGKIMVQLTAHSVVGNEKSSELFDITQRDETLRFVEHIGDAKTFDEFKDSNCFIVCQCQLNSPR
jgi:hypothetical protein